MHGIIMAGRKRKAGDRYPSGDLKPERTLTLTRRIAAYARHAGDQRLTNALGWLRLEEKLTDNQVEAGQRFAILVGQHDRANGFPRRSVAPISYQRGYGLAGTPPIDAEAITRVCSRYEAADICLTDKERVVVLAVCLEDQVPSWADLRTLNLGLAALAVHFRII